MSAISDETREFLLRDAFHESAACLAHSSAFLMAGAHIADASTLRFSVSAARESLLEIIRLLKQLETIGAT